MLYRTFHHTALKTRWTSAVLPVLMLLLMLAVVAGCPTAKAATPSSAPRSIRLMDAHWQIDKMPAFNQWKPKAVLTSAEIAQLHCPWPKGTWKPVQLPDDYIVAGKITRGNRPFNRRNRLAFHGYLPVYPAWYHRTFNVPASARGKTIWLNFGGVYRDSVVFVNGHLVGQHPSGYTGFRYNIGKYVHAGKTNTLAVFVDPRWFEGWWYEGGGIYRHVRLMITDKLHVAPWGTFVISKVPGSIHYSTTDGDHASAQLTIQTTVHNAHHTGRKFTLVSQIISPAGKVIATLSTPEHLAAGQKALLTQHAAIDNAALWSLHHCNLYHLVTRITIGHAVVDNKRTTFGIRTLRFDPDHGFFLNGKHVEIDGTCNHQDFPAVGIGAPDNLWPWRIAKLKALGSNAYRTTHNPLDSAFYRACDHMGMLVMDENRHLGDAWTAKSPRGTRYSNLSDLKWMILAQRNDPCVIFWSMCNEEHTLEGTREGARIFAAMTKAVHQIDPTRPVTCAMNTGFNNKGFFSVENLLGINYTTGKYSSFHRMIPNKMIYGSEDVNIFSDRGVLKTSRKAGVVNDYGSGPRFRNNRGQFWFMGHHAPWNASIPVMTHPFVAGEFVWTGFDYRGEPVPFGWPAVDSQFGMMDLCGFPKAVYYYWNAWWRKKPSVYIFPAWTFPKSMIGKPILIRCYSNCQRVGLFLNGKSLGTQAMPKYKYLDWTVPYAPGKLTARGYDGSHKAVARWSCRTAGSAAALQLRDEVSTLTADGESLAPVEVKMVDAHGIMVPNAHNMVHFTVSGPGSIAGVNNGNSASHESNVGHQVRVFHGLALVMIRAGRHPGVITLTATANGVSAGTLQIHTIAH